MSLKFINAHIVDYCHNFFGEISVEDGKICALGSSVGEFEEVIDCKGKTLMPSFVELHAHFREPGFEEKETIETGQRAAAKGGYTFVNVMANTKPVCSSLEQFEENNGKFNLIDGNQVVSLTENFDGKTLSHLDRLNGKVKIISEDGKGIRNSLILLKALELLKKYDMLLMIHAEDMDISGEDYRLGENLETFRDISLAESGDFRIHFSHVSTKEAIEAIRLAKKRGVRVTCEVTPHHISLFDSDYRVNPPIRTKEDIKAIIEGIKDGTVDAIATDHAPHTEKDKANGAPGMVGLETAFGVCNKVFCENNLRLSTLSKLLSKNPADILGIKKGRFEIGYDADFVLVDEDEEWTVRKENFLSRSRNSPFDGMKLRGRVLATYKAGVKL